MNKESTQHTQCPVCDMVVNKGDIELSYQGLIFAFCSQQCKDRFAANPHLYIGMPGHPAPKYLGHELIKTRILKLQESLTTNQQQVVIADLMNMMGIKKVSVDIDRVLITYDLLQATVEQIEATIEKSGDKLGGGLGEKLKRAFIHYLEESELDNLEQSGHSHRH